MNTKYTYRHKLTDRYISNFKKGRNRFLLKIYGSGIDEITVGAGGKIKIELLKDGDLYINNKDYFDQYISKIYLSVEPSKFIIALIPEDEFIKTNLEDDLIVLPGRARMTSTIRGEYNLSWDDVVQASTPIYWDNATVGEMPLNTVHGLEDPQDIQWADPLSDNQILE